MKVLELRNRGYDSILVKVQDSFEVNIGDVVLVEKYFIRNSVDLLLLPVINIEENATNISNKVIAPAFIATLKLDEYKLTREKFFKKIDLEKQLDSAVKSIEKASKYKALVELNPELKDVYNEYISLITEDTKKLLN